MSSDPSLRRGPSAGESLSDWMIEFWRQRIYRSPYLTREIFYTQLVEGGEGWDDTRAEVAALREIADLLAASPPAGDSRLITKEEDDMSQRYSRPSSPVGPEASSVPTGNVTAWLIESASPQGCPQYWDGRKDNCFSIDPNEAVRFATFESAERVRAYMLSEPIRWHCRSAQHMWMEGD